MGSDVATQPRLRRSRAEQGAAPASGDTSFRANQKPFRLDLCQTIGGSYRYTEAMGSATHKRMATRRLPGGRWLCLAAALFATGLAWDLLQFTAWGGMYLHNLRDRDAAAALARTFSEEGRCPVCETVEMARQGDGHSSVFPSWSLRAWLLPFQATPCTVRPPAPSAAPQAMAWRQPVSRSDRPALPPPKQTRVAA